MIDSEALTHPGISHGFFTRGGGHSTGIFASLNCGLGSGDDPDLVRMNRETVARVIGVFPSNLVTAHQVHSAEALEVIVPWSTTERPKVDGLVTKTKGIGIGVLTADCGPVLFSDPEAGVVGACHAGWKGALTGVTEATLQAMERLGACSARRFPRMPMKWARSFRFHSWTRMRITRSTSPQVSKPAIICLICHAI
jgi:polyphenol oxidase